MKNIPTMLTSSIFKKMKRIKSQMQIYLCPHFFLLPAGPYIEVDALLGLCLVVLQFLWSSGLDLCSLPRSTAEACRIVAGQDCGGTGKVICRVEARIGCNQVDNLVTTDDNCWQGRGCWWQDLQAIWGYEESWVESVFAQMETGDKDWQLLNWAVNGLSSVRIRCNDEYRLVDPDIIGRQLQSMKADKWTCYKFINF